MTHRRTPAPRWTVIALATLVPAAVLSGSVGLAMADEFPGTTRHLPGATATGRDQDVDGERVDGEDGERSAAARRPVRRVVTSGAGTAELDSLLRDIERLHRQVRVLRLQVAALESATGATASSSPSPTPSEAADPSPAASPPPESRPTTTRPTATRPTVTRPTTAPAPAATPAPTTHATTGASS